jgi:hypothetical protein
VGISTGSKDKYNIGTTKSTDDFDAGLTLEGKKWVENPPS